MSRSTVSCALALSILTLGTSVWGVEQPAVPAPAAPGATNVIGPKIKFETTVHDFGRAKSGEQVKYTYAFTNVGDQLLEVTGVHACGCITANWTRMVEPGKTGTIPISFNSAGYGGQVVKMITVNCNDRINPRPMLQFKGTVWKPIDVIPQFVVLNLTADAPLASATVSIVNNLPEPINLSPPQCSNPAFAVELKTNQPGKEFHLVIAPVSVISSGNAQAQITMQTSSANMPVIAITAFANVQPAVAIYPQQIVLRTAPLAQRQVTTINFIDNSTNALALSEPTVNVPGVDVQLKETQPGRRFAVALAFPQGFEIPPDRKAELSIKSSLRLLPVLKVPILQARAPAPPQVAPVPLSSSTQTNQHRMPRRSDLPPPPPLPPLPR